MVFSTGMELAPGISGEPVAMVRGGLLEVAQSTRLLKASGASHRRAVWLTEEGNVVA